MKLITLTVTAIIAAFRNLSASRRIALAPLVDGEGVRYMAMYRLDRSIPYFDEEDLDSADGLMLRG